MLTIQAKVHCDEFGCVAHEAVTLKVFQGEVLVKRHGSSVDVEAMGRVYRQENTEGVSLTQFELTEDTHTHGWTVNFSGCKSYCPEHAPYHNKSQAW